MNLKDKEILGIILFILLIVLLSIQIINQIEFIISTEIIKKMIK
ncbi:hypothetical protein [Clostridium sp.]